MARIIAIDAGVPDQITTRNSKDQLEVMNDAIGNSIQHEFVEEVITSMTRAEISKTLLRAQAALQCCGKCTQSEDEE